MTQHFLVQGFLERAEKKKKLDVRGEVFLTEMKSKGLTIKVYLVC